MSLRLEKTRPHTIQALRSESSCLTQRLHQARTALDIAHSKLAQITELCHSPTPDPDLVFKLQAICSLDQGHK